MSTQYSTLPSLLMIIIVCGGGVLVLVELLFFLPASTGKLEQVFSTLHTVKVDKCLRLTGQSLDDVLLLKSDKIPLAGSFPDPSIDLWRSAKARRPSQKERKEYKPHSSACPSTS